jgi:FkbM family methyltransferase
MSNLRRIAQWIRHLPGLERADPLWSLVRRPYQRLLNSGGSGVRVLVGGVAAVRMPAEFAGGSWEQHEPETVSAFAQWIGTHPSALVLDIGSSIGIFSAVALFADPQAEVVAFDSDLSSLAAVRRLCQHASGTRLRVVRGFLAEKSTAIRSLAEAVVATEEALAQSNVRGDVGTTRYICLTDRDSGSIPSHRLDDIFAGESINGRAVLIKCDVEGAELLVLRGAETFLRREAPALLLSVHPPALPSYGYSKADVEAFLERVGYEHQILAVDHEEHWWCLPSSR